MRRAAAAGAVVLAGLAGCGSDPARQPTATQKRVDLIGPGPTKPTRQRVVPALCGRLHRRTVARLQADGLDELSGLAASRTQPGVLYAIEDSGNPPDVLELDTRGRLRRTFRVSGAQNVDWEDVATRGGQVYVADIGDNDSVRDHVSIYRVDPSGGASARTDLRYPDGPHDAEALIADPLRDDLVIVTKGLFGGRAYVSHAGGPAKRGPKVPLPLVTGATISADGRTVVLRTYDRFAVYRRHGREPLMRTLARRACSPPTNLTDEGQGEAVVLSGGALYTAPEGTSPALRRYAPR